LKVLILAGGYGTRISEETSDKPKPMVRIGKYPILWHIMNTFASQGLSDFLIATGYKAEVIDNWVAELDTPWNIQVLNTGLDTQTGGRISRAFNNFPVERMVVTYGDGLANVNVRQLIDFHAHQGRIATVTAVHPPARFGVLESQNGQVTSFGEKSQAHAGWINGGYFVLEKKIVDYIDSDDCSFEFTSLPRLVAHSELSAFNHEGFWQPMDTLREKNELEKFADSPNPPWSIIS
jgi:glucose-1-phosphate cytidylyltransferase